MEVFTDSFVPPGLDDVWFATRGCPACLGTSLTRVRALHAPHWLCTSCGRCWRVEHGMLRPVDALSCPGCATRAKSDCIAVFAAHMPRFGAGVGADEHL
jgi:hypothetical protein